MRGAMKAISADAVLTVEAIGKSVQKSVFRQRLVKRGVEYRDLRDRRSEKALGGFDGAQFECVVLGRTTLDA